MIINKLDILYTPTRYFLYEIVLNQTEEKLFYTTSALNDGSYETGTRNKSWKHVLRRAGSKATIENATLTRIHPW